MDCIVCGVAKSQTQLSDFRFHSGDYRKKAACVEYLLQIGALGIEWTLAINAAYFNHCHICLTRLFCCLNIKIGKSLGPTLFFNPVNPFVFITDC